MEMYPISKQWAEAIVHARTEPTLVLRWRESRYRTLRKLGVRLDHESLVRWRAARAALRQRRVLVADIDEWLAK